MSKLEDLQPGLRLAGVIPGQNVSVVAVQPHGVDAIELTYKTAEGELAQRVLGRDAEGKLAIAQARPLDAVADDFRLVAECPRIKLAGLPTHRTEPAFDEPPRRRSQRERAQGGAALLSP